jgi:ribosomal protein S18 acetylase RimI-like enzyme
MEVKIRKATAQDCRFIAELIFLAESTGAEITSYEKMFGKPASELIPTFEKMLNNPSKGHPLTFESYVIAEVDGKLAGGLSAYTEGEHGDSNHMMTGALMYAFDRQEVQQAFKFLAENKDVQMDKRKGNLQLDCVGTFSEFAGLGIFSSLLNYVEEEFKSQGGETAEIQVWKKNEHAVHVYEKKGYRIFAEKLCVNDPSNGKVLMEKEL